MKLVVTGSTGFVGQAVSACLESDGHEVVRIARRRINATSFVIPDIGAETNWSTALPGADCIVHCAARVHVMHDSAVDPLEAYREVNVAGTRRLAEQAVAYGVRRFVFLSSVKVNGEATEPSTAYTDADIPAPKDAYGQSKQEAEQVLMEMSRQTGLEVVIIRPPLIYGPGVKGNFSSLVKLVRKGIPLPLGAVDNRRSLVALDNIVSFIALCADLEKSSQAANQVFMISDGEDISTSDLLYEIAKAYGVKARMIPLPISWLKFGARLLGKAIVADRLFGSLRVDSSKAHILLDWQPVITIDEQLRKMAEYDAGI